MKKSKPKRDVNSSKCSIVTIPTTVPDVCQCTSKSREVNQFLYNLESNEEDLRFRNFFQKVTAALGKKNKNITSHLHPYSSKGNLTPYELCPFVHGEVGLWKILSYGVVKSGCTHSNSGAAKRGVDVKQTKVTQKPVTQVKKPMKSKSGDPVVSVNQSSFRHNVPVEQILQEYRENNMYSKFRLSRVNGKAILNAIHSTQPQNEHSPPVLLENQAHARETCAQIVNLSFHENDIREKSKEDSLNKFKKRMQHNQPTTLMQAGMNFKRAQHLPHVMVKKIGSINISQPNYNSNETIKSRDKTKIWLQ